MNVGSLGPVILALEKIRRKLCGYGGHTPCDCKYGASFEGEQTGCPELRSAIVYLSEISDKSPEEKKT